MSPLKFAASAALLPLLVLTGCAAKAAPETAQEAPGGVVSMYQTLEREIAESGGETTTGEWRIGYVVEPAEPWFEGTDGVFREPQVGETHHIEIIPLEKSTGRIIPNTPIHVEVLDGDGIVVDEQDLNPYYAEFFHYANNFSVPEPGSYTLRATIGAPTFLRHGDESEAPALGKGTTVTFTGVELTTE